MGAACARGPVPPGRPLPSPRWIRPTGRSSWRSWPAATCRRPGRRRSPPTCGCSPPWTPELAATRPRLLGAARRLRGARALAESIYGVGPVTGLALTCWLGGKSRFSSARKAVRFCGLDITVCSSDSKRSPGHLSRQGPPVLRWCAYEAGKTHARAVAPDHGYYATVKDRKDGKRAALAEARKIVRRACRILADLGDDALTMA